MNLFSQSRHISNTPARRFELLHSIICIAMSFPQVERALTFGLFALIGRKHGQMTRSKWSHRSITLTPEEIGEEINVEAGNVAQKINDLQRNMHRLPVQFGGDPGHKNTGTVFFDILSVHESLDSQKSLVWWVRPGMWIDTHLSSDGRHCFFSLMSCISDTSSSNVRQAVCAIGLAMAHARDRNLLINTEEIALDCLLDFAAEVTSDQLQRPVDGNELTVDERAVLSSALDLLLLKDVIESYRTDRDGRLWLTTGSCLT